MVWVCYSGLGRTHPSHFVSSFPPVFYQNLATISAAEEHLGTFFVVGIVEQYEGFIHVLRQTLDPELEHPSVWEEALETKNNG